VGTAATTSRSPREAALRHQRAPRSNGPLIEALPLALIVLAATAFAARWSLATDEWRVMTDEMQYLKLAQSVSETLSPLPYVHGESYGSYSQLFPILLAPALWLFDVPIAFRIGHALNALLMASTAVPAYLLTRLLVPSRLAALTAGALSAFVPWLTFSLSLMTESVGYPAFMWAAFASVLSLVRPSVKHDALALVAIFAAYLARTQFIFLALAFPVAVLLHEALYRLAGAAPRHWPRRLWDGLRAGVASHPLVVAATVIGLIGLVISSYAPLGSYESVVTSQQGLPPGMLDAMYDHLNPIVIGLGVAPVVLALAWAGETLLRPSGRAVHAFVVYAALVIPAVAVTATYFDLTHVGSVQERYVFYIAPLLLVGAVGYLVAGRWPLPSLALAGIAVALLLVQSSYPPIGEFPAFSSPVRFTWTALDFRAGQIGSVFGLNDLGTAPVLAATTALLSAALILLLRSRRRALALPATAGILLVWSVAVTAYVFPKVLTEHEYLAQGALGKRAVADRDWIDAAVSGDATVALLPSAINSRAGSPIPLGTNTNQAVWWEAEFWNKAVRRTYGYPGAPTYTPFPLQAMALDADSGRLRVSGEESDYLVWAPSNVLVGLDGTPVASYRDLLLYRPERPYRAAWATSGVADDGRLPTGRFGLTVHGRQREGARLHRVRLLLVPGVPRLDRYRVRGAGVDLRGRMSAAPPVSFDVCVRAGGREPLRVATDPASQARLVKVDVDASSAPC
jgi:hypothetical protein